MAAFKFKPLNIYKILWQQKSDCSAVVVRTMLSGGVKKGAFDEAACQQKFDAWKQAKVAATEAVEKQVTDDKKKAAAQNLEAEKKVNEAIAKKVADKKAAAVAAKAEAEAAQAAEDTAAEAPAEA